jgi:hypothetical protein
MAIAEAKARRAALAVHALPAQDQARVLAQLDAVQRERIAPLLAELKALGIPPSMLAASIAGETAPPEVSAPGARLALLDPAASAKALAGSETVVAAALLRSAPPSWRNAVMQAMPSSQREALAARLTAGGTMPPKAVHALYTALESALRAPVALATRDDRTPRTAVRRWLPWTR